MTPDQLPLAIYSMSMAHNWAGAQGAASAWLQDAHAPPALPVSIKRPEAGVAAGNASSRPHTPASPPCALSSLPQQLHFAARLPSPSHQQQHQFQASPGASDGRSAAHASDADAEPAPRPSPRLRPYHSGSLSSSQPLPQPMLIGGAQLLRISAACGGGGAAASPRSGGGGQSPHARACSGYGSPSRARPGLWSDRQDALLRSSLEGAGQQAAMTEAALDQAEAAAAGSGSGGGWRSAAAAPHSFTGADVGCAGDGGPRRSPHGLFAFPANDGPELGSSYGARSVSSSGNSSGPRLGSPVKAAAAAAPGGGGRTHASAYHTTQTLSAAGPQVQELAGCGLDGHDGGELLCGDMGPTALRHQFEARRPGSPAVAADVALSHLALLQRLNHGELGAGVQQHADGEGVRPMSAPGVHGGVSGSGSPVPCHVIRPAGGPHSKLRSSLESGWQSAARVAAAMSAAEEAIHGAAYRSPGTAAHGGSLPMHYQQRHQQQGQQQALPGGAAAEVSLAYQRADPLRRSLEAGCRMAHAAGEALDAAEHFVSGSRHAALAAALAQGGSDYEGSDYGSGCDYGGGRGAPGWPGGASRSSLPAMLSGGDGGPPASPTQAVRPLRRLAADPLRWSLEQSSGAVGGAAAALGAAAAALGATGPHQLAAELSFGVQGAGSLRSHSPLRVEQQQHFQRQHSGGSVAGNGVGEVPGLVLGIPVGCPPPSSLVTPASAAAAAAVCGRPCYGSLDTAGSGAWSVGSGSGRRPGTPGGSPGADEQTRALQLEVANLKMEVGGCGGRGHRAWGGGGPCCSCLTVLRSSTPQLSGVLTWWSALPHAPPRSCSKCSTSCAVPAGCACPAWGRTARSGRPWRQRQPLCRWRQHRRWCSMRKLQRRRRRRSPCATRRGSWLQPLSPAQHRLQQHRSSHSSRQRPRL